MSKDSLALVVDRLEQLLQQLRAEIPPEWFTMDLTMPQFRALMVLHEHGPCRMGVLASRLGVSLSGATSLMDRLVQKGIVGRWVNPEERRSVFAGLTGEGKDLAGSLLRLRRSRWEERLESIDLPDLDLVAKALDRLVRGLGWGSQGQTRDFTTAPPIGGSAATSLSKRVSP